MKPIMSFFRQPHKTPTDRDTHKLRQERGRRKVLEKSASVMEHFEYGAENTEWQRPQAVKAVSNRESCLSPGEIIQIANSETVPLCHH